MEGKEPFMRVEELFMEGNASFVNLIVQGYPCEVVVRSGGDGTPQLPAATVVPGERSWPPYHALHGDYPPLNAMARVIWGARCGWVCG